MERLCKELQQKFDNLKQIIKSMDSLLIAYSGGVDSTLLIKVAYDVLGTKAMACIAESDSYPTDEVKHAKRMAEAIGIRFVVIKTDELSQPEFYKNTAQRCFYCKSELFCKLREVADRYGISELADGSNYEDFSDYRPGLSAAKLYQVRHPLYEARLTKKDIRELSKFLGLATWDKPSFACLASRFPYGEEITPDKLKQVWEAEKFIKSLGISQLRVRQHQDIARIEVSIDDLQKIIDHKEEIVQALKRLGYIYITLDLEGYRSGSMNEPLKQAKP